MNIFAQVCECIVSWYVRGSVAGAKEVGLNYSTKSLQTSASLLMVCVRALVLPYFVESFHLYECDWCKIILTYCYEFEYLHVFKPSVFSFLYISLHSSGTFFYGVLGCILLIYKSALYIKGVSPLHMSKYFSQLDFSPLILCTDLFPL